MSKQEQQSFSSHRESRLHIPWWIHLCRILWKSIALIGSTVVLGAVASLIATWLTSSKGVIPADSPLREVFAYWPTALSIGCCLLLLALLVWVLSRWPVQDEISLSLAQQSRERMLRRLRRMYHDMLEQSLQKVSWIDLGLAQHPDAVYNATSLLVHFAHRGKQLLPPGTSIMQVYEEAAHELLILGEPGAGKSSLLLKLAEQLVEQAEQERTEPLPVFLPLSSWAVSRMPLYEWLAEQVAELYNIPIQITQQWVRNEQLLPLLDGLDEMEETVRPDCIAAINAYHHAHPGPLVVCSRKAEYEHAATSHRLNLQNAVVIQPLSREQIDDYLEQAGKPLEALHRKLKRNPPLQELATTPLMLGVLMLTYQGTSVRALSKKKAELGQQVWTDYVQRMVERKRGVSNYSCEHIIMWLGWLARQMQQHNQTIFYLEQLQPYWLPKRQRIFYQLSIVPVIALSVVLFEQLIWTLIFGLTYWLLNGKLPGEVLYGLLGALPVGLLAGLGLGLFFGLRAIQPSEALTWSWKDVWSRLLAGLLIGFSGAGGLILFKGLITRISGKQLTERSYLSPNEGIWRSAKNGLFVGLFVGPFCGLAVALFVALTQVPIFGLAEGLFYSLVMGLFIGLIAGLGAFIQHYTLRFWLQRSHVFPWKAQQFLEYATSLILLRRVGGGYSFFHRLLLDYFADLDAGSALASDALPTAKSDLSLQKNS